MDKTTERSCADCDVPLQDIKLIDKAHHASHNDMEYAQPDAKRSFWSGKYPVAGQVLAMMCPDCGRITLYAAPKVN